MALFVVSAPVGRSESEVSTGRKPMRPIAAVVRRLCERLAPTAMLGVTACGASTGPTRFDTNLPPTVETIAALGDAAQTAECVSQYANRNLKRLIVKCESKTVVFYRDSKLHVDCELTDKTECKAIVNQVLDLAQFKKID